MSKKQKKMILFDGRYDKRMMVGIKILLPEKNNLIVGMSYIK